MPHKYNPNFAAARRRERAKNIEIRVPHWWNTEVKSKTAIVVCPKCHALYFDKHWHSWSHASQILPVGHKVSEELCAACRSTDYAGEVTLSGFADPAFKLEVIRTAKNVAARALERDPEAQVIKIEDKGRTVRITTTQNQLAEAIGKEIDRSHKGGELSIRFSNEELPVRVYWNAKT